MPWSGPIDPFSSPSEQLAALQARLQAATDSQERARLHLQMGHLYVREVGDFSRAEEHYRQAYDLNPNDLSPLQTLRQLAQKQARWADAIEVGQLQAERMPDSEEKVSLWLEIASIWVNHYAQVERAVPFFVRAADLLMRLDGGEERAFALYLQALSLSPSDMQAFTGLARICSQRKYWKRLPPEYQAKLERLLSEQSRWNELLAIYRVEVEVPGDDRQAALTYLKMGEILEQNLERFDAALNAYKMAVALFPQDLRAFESVRQLLRKLNRHEELIEHLETHLEFAEERDRQMALLMEIARIEQHEMQDAVRAEKTLRRTLSIDPHYFPAHEALVGLMAQAYRWRDLYDFLKARLGVVTELRLRGALFEELGKVCADRLGIFPEALEHFNACLRVNPTNLAAIRGLDFVYSKLAQWDKLIPILVARATQSRDSREKARAYGRLGRIFWNNKHDPAQAEQNFRRMIELTDSKLLGFLLLDRLYRDTQQIEARIQLARERAYQSASIERRRQILLDLAKELEVVMEMPERAESLYREVQDLGVEDEGAADSLKRIYRDQERWPELYELCRRELEVATDEVRRVENLIIMGELDEYQFEHLDKAAASYEEILRLNARNMTALKGLERIYLKNQDWQRLREIYRRGIDLAQDLREEAYLNLRLGQVTEHLSMEAPAQNSGASRSLQQEAVKYFEAALLRDPDLIAALKGLIGLYDRLELWPDLVRVRKLFAETIDEPLEKAEQYFRIAEALESKLTSEAEAVRFYEMAARLDPEHAGVMQRLAVYYYQSEQWERALSVHEALAQRVRSGTMHDPRDLLAFFYRLGVIYSKLQRFGHARAAMLEAKRRNPGFVPVRKALADFYFLNREWNEAIAEWSAILPSLGPEEQVDVHLKLGAAQAAIGHLTAAEMHFKEALQRDPLNETANASLLNLFQTGNRPDAMADLLAKRMAALDSPDVSVQEGLRLVALQANSLGDVQGALHTVERLQQRHPDHPEVLRWLGDLLKRLGRLDELQALLRRRMSLPAGDDDKNLRLDLAETLERQQPESNEAVVLFQEVLDRDQREPRALKGLERLYLRQKRWRDLIGIYEAEQRLCRSDEEAAVFSFKMAEVEAAHLKREDDAILHYKDAVTKDPHLRPALEALRKIYDTRGEWDKIPNLLVQELALADSRSEEARLHYELGRLFEERLERPDKALKHFQDSLRVVENYLPAARRLAVYYYQQSDWVNAEKYYDLLAKDFASPETAQDPQSSIPRVAAGFFYKYGKIAERLGKEEKSIHCYRRSLEQQQDFFPALAALAEVCQRKGWWDEAKVCVEQILRLDLDPMQASSENWQFQLARIEEKLGNRELAMARYKEVIKHDENHIESLQALVRYYEEDGKWRVAVGLYDKLQASFEQRQDKDAVFDVLMNKGRIWDERLQDAVQARLAYDQALQLSEGRARGRMAQRALTDLAIRQKDWPQLIATLPAALEKDPNLFGSGIEYRLYLAEAYTEQGRYDEALSQVSYIFEENPNHARALEVEAALLARRRDWKSLLENLRRRIKTTPSHERARLVGLHRELGDLYSRELKDQRQAVDAYRKALSIDPHAVEVHRQLASVYSDDEAFYLQAIKEHHFLLDSDPLNPESYHHLGSIYETRGEMTRVRALYDALLLLGEATDREQAVLKRLAVKPAPLDETLPPSAWREAIIDPREKNILGNIWSLIAEKVTELLEAEIPAEQRQAFKEIPWKGGAGQQKLFAHLAQLLGVNDVSLFTAPGAPLYLELFPSRPPSLVLGEGAMKLNSPAAQRFTLSRALAHLRLNHVLPLHLSEEHLKRLFFLIAKLIREDLTLEGYDEKGLRADLKRLRRVLDKAMREALTPLVDEFLLNLRRLDFKLWRRALDCSADRAGLFVAQDLRACLEMLSTLGEGGRTLNLQSSSEVRRLLESQPRALEVFKFSTSLEFFSLRENLRMKVDV